MTVQVPTNPTSLYALIQAAIAARNNGDVIDSSASTYQLTAALGNLTTVIYVGDRTLNASGSPLVGVGAELVAGAGFFNPYEGGGMRSLDLTPLYVQASAGTTNYLNVRVQMAS